MLTYEALISEATLRGMPSVKVRGILREYLQILILREMYRIKDGRKLFFTGGTYLRLAHQTRRFSEDLNFNTSSLDRGTFEKVLEQIRGALGKEGLTAKLEFGHWGNILVAELIFPDIERTYGIVSPNSKKEGIVIKVETNLPAWEIKTETLAISGFGYIYPVVCTDRGALFADKIDALIKKNRARHLFDIIFMLSQKYPVDMNVFHSFKISDEPFAAILKRVADLSPQELKKQAESLRPFLFDENEAELIVNAPVIVKQLIDRY